MTRILVDRRGRFRQIERGIPRSVASRIPPGLDFAEYAVRYLGDIEISVLDAGARVRLRPSIQQDPAIAEVLFELGRIQPRRILLSHWDKRWIDEMVAGYPHLVARIQQLVYGDRSRYPDKRFHAEVQEIAAGSDTLHQPFGRLIELWSRRRGILSQDVVDPFRRAGCIGRTTLVDVTREDRMVVSHRGRHLTHYGRTGWTGAVGKPIDAQPDPVFAAAAARAYLDVRNAGQPRIETCEAGIRRPDGAGRRSVYDRLLLPWRTDTGRVFVSGVSVLRGRTDWIDPTKPSRSATSSGDDIQTHETS
ncbi:MAG: hypothetical protein AB7O45_13280 [Alphaproteobacteria bacterium]